MKVTTLDSAPYTLIQEGSIIGAANPITGQRFVNLTEVEGRLTVDPSIKREALVAQAQQSSFATIVEQDTFDGRFQPRDLSIEDRKALAGQQ